MYLLIIALPLLGSLLTGFLGRIIGRYGASIFATSSVFISMIFSSFAFYEIGLTNIICYIHLSD